ncbi:ropporin-1-like protein [Centruroides vittatus]|uniref:ropporin-1-like protein n=1 Tax=Centruroides vittatus TaxID=120091 RepID=UPI0035102CE1
MSADQRQEPEELSKYDVDSEGPLCTADRIKIPPDMSEIMKQFTKAAIRTQPPDLLFWSKAYFQALSEGNLPPVKERFEIKIPLAYGLSREILQTLHKQLGHKKKVKIDFLKKKWMDFCLQKEHLILLLKKSGYVDQQEVNWLEFLAVACMSINNTMIDTMIMICEILTDDPRGGPARIPFVIFEHLYRFLANINGRIPLEQVEIAMNYLAKESSRQQELIKPRNFLFPDCPPINELPIDKSESELYWKEEELKTLHKQLEHKIGEEEELGVLMGTEEEYLPSMEEIVPPQDFALLFKRRFHRWRKLN